MRRWATSGALLLTSVLIAAIGGMAAWNARTGPSQQGQVARFVLPVQGGTILPGDLELSRDAAFLAYSSGRPGARTLFVRRLATPDAEPVAVIEGGEGPFFSPDSQWLGFFADGKMKKISLRGGAPVTLADAPSQRGADWGEEAPVNPTRGARLVWVDRRGQTSDIAAPVRNYSNPSLSPDGGRVALSIATAEQSNIWIFDLLRDALVRLTFEGQSGWPVWSRDGREMIYASNRSGTSWDLYRKSTDGTGVEASILVKPLLQIPHALSDKGGLLALTEIGPSSFHTAMLSMRDGTLNVRVNNAWTPSLSPDGRWLAYTSNDGGRYDVYVRPTSGAAGRWQISMEGGVAPVWSATGSELFLRHEEEVLAVDVVTNPTFAHGRPRKLFEGRYALGDVKNDTRAYDVAPDGQRFLMLRPESEPSRGDLKVVVNWYDELQRLGHPRE